MASLHAYRTAAPACTLQSFPRTIPAVLGGLGLCACAGMAMASTAGSTAPSEVSIYAAGDIADCRRSLPESSGAAATAALIHGELLRNSQAAVLALGDSTYPDGHPAEFASCYQPTWGQFKQRTYPVPGNHEYRTRAASGYFQYFGAAARPEQNGYYSFVLGDWHIVALNSNLQGEEFSVQMEWLKSDLQRSKATCTLAYWHHPVFSSGGHGNSDAMLPAWRILAAAKAELVLSAHDHHYERFAPMDGNGKRDDRLGMRQFVVGTGGARLTRIRMFTRHSEASGNASHGVLKLKLMPGAYAWEFLPVTSGVQTDNGTGTCH